MLMQEVQCRGQLECPLCVVLLVRDALDRGVNRPAVEGEIAMDVQGKAGLVLPGGDFDEWQRLYLFTRADTIYGGSNEIQRNIIAERVLGLPREAR